MNELGAGWLIFFPIVLALAASGIAGLLWIFKHAHPFYRSVATVLTLTGLVSTGQSLIFIDPDRVVLWRSIVLFGELLQPAAILYISVALFNPSESGLYTSTRWWARAAMGVGSLLALIVCWNLVFSGTDGGRLSFGDPQISRYPVPIFIILTLVLGIAYLEQCLRAMRDPIRYQLKYILIGLGALAGMQTYHVSQFLVIQVQEIHAVLISSLGSLMAVGLIAYGLGRNRLRETTSAIYVSPGVVYGSVTFIVVGLYLIAVGTVGELIRYSGLPLSEVVGGLVVFVGAIALVVLIFSRSVRARLKLWIARGFYHAKYDYRAKWLEVTDAFQACDTAESVLDQLLNMLSRTFGAPRISIWVRYDSDRQFHMVRSTNTEPPPPAISEAHPVITSFQDSDEPVEVPAPTASVGGSHDPFYIFTQATVSVPIRTEQQLLGFVTLSQDVQKERYGMDDRMLLRALAHHASMLLVLAQHTEERRAAVGLEALHRFSAFCLHDLKNLTARLSLVVQNAEVHGHDPGFQQSAMRTVAGTVEKMVRLMEKLSLKTNNEGQWEIIDLGHVIHETVRSLNFGRCVDMQGLGTGPLPVRAVREELQQVFMNLLLNARQAAGEQGMVSIASEAQDRIVTVRVTDDGPGIPPDRLRTLFQPFQTTKTGGLGIGLYECKRVVESYHGTIRVMSEVGKGTTIRIELPIMSDSRPPQGEAVADQQADTADLTVHGAGRSVSRAQEGSVHE